MQYISTNSGEMKNEECLNNFKLSSNQNNRSSAVKRAVKSLQESVCNVEDVMIKIHRLRVYYSPLL